MKILVADDEALARDYLVSLVRQLGEPYEVAGEAANGREAVARCEADPVDLVLMDIQMPGMDGLEAVRRIAQMPVPPAVIFTTAYAEHALPAFEVNGAGYLLKPIRPEKLKEALEKVTQVTRPLLGREEIRPELWITARFRGNLERIPFSSVYYFRAESKYVVVRHEGGEALIEESLKRLEKRFGERLLRVHRNALVVPERIAGLERGPEGSMVLAFDGIDDRIEVSRRHLPQVRRLLRATAT
ncbi:MAG: DNA-binding response regulator [Gammaproteobacteria bacterium]|nr:MAG: DNA-binding response regulator [Gammaproteobacteria bacterium]